MGQLEKVPFLTPIESEKHYLLMMASNYFSVFGQLGARAVNYEGDRVLCESGEVDPSSMRTSLKVASMILSFGIFPLLALFVVAIERFRKDFFWELKDIDVRLDASSEVNRKQLINEEESGEFEKANAMLAALQSDSVDLDAQDLFSPAPANLSRNKEVERFS